MARAVSGIIWAPRTRQSWMGEGNVASHFVVTVRRWSSSFSIVRVTGFSPPDAKGEFIEGLDSILQGLQSR